MDRFDIPAAFAFVASCAEYDESKRDIVWLRDGTGRRFSAETVAMGAIREGVNISPADVRNIRNAMRAFVPRWRRPRMHHE